MKAALQTPSRETVYQVETMTSKEMPPTGADARKERSIRT